MEINMKKFVILGVALALAGCGGIPEGSTAAKLDSGSTLHTVCLDGVEYWFREGNNAVLAPRLKAGSVSTVAQVVPCTTPTETNDAAVIGVVSQM